MKKICLILLIISLITTNIYATDLFQDTSTQQQIFSIFDDNSTNNNFNNPTDLTNQSIDLTTNTALTAATTGADDMQHAATDKAFEQLNTDVNSTVTNDNMFDDLTNSTLDTVSDLESQDDLTDDMLNSLLNTPQESQPETFKGTIDTDADGDLSTSDSPVKDLTQDDGDNEKEKKDADGESDEQALPKADATAFFFIDLFSPCIYADEKTVKETNEETTKTIDEDSLNSDNTTPSSQKTYYLHTDLQSYIIETEDEYIEYFISLIANKNITVEVSADQLSNVRISALHISVLEEISEKIWEKFNNFCTEKLKDLLPTGVFFTKDNKYYFTDTSTDEFAIVKTDDYLLQILIPLIADTGVETSIYHDNIGTGMIYVSEVILQEDLPTDIAQEYKKQYKEYLQNNIFNITGYITISNNTFYIETESEKYKITTDDKQIASALISLVNYWVKAHGYIDPDNNLINVIQIEY